MRRILFSFCLIGIVTTGWSATNELDIARQALRDGLWDVARTHAEKAGTNETARLLVLESWASEGKWQKVSEALAAWTNATGSAFAYYRAVVRGDSETAARILAAGGTVEGAVQARLFEAERLAKAGREKAAQALWRSVCLMTNVVSRAFAVAASNLMEPQFLREAYQRAPDALTKRPLAIRLGLSLLKAPATRAEGAKLIRDIARESPDTPGSRDAFLSLADAELAAAKWSSAEGLFRSAIEIWPAAARLAVVQEGLGWALSEQGKLAEALDAFARAEQLAETDTARATAALKRGDVLSRQDKMDEAIACYRAALAAYPKAAYAKRLSEILQVRDLEEKGRQLYRRYRFSEALKIFQAVAARDASRADQMRFFEALCLYGAGEDAKAVAVAESLATTNAPSRIAQDALVWLAKFHYNRREWKVSSDLFSQVADCAKDDPETASRSLLWSARASFVGSDYARVIQLTTQLAEKHPKSVHFVPAMILQGEALNELARFDEAILLFERVAASPAASPEDRSRAQLLRADSLFAMGADNAARYATALEAYRTILFGETLSPSVKLVVSYKIGRVLEKQRRMDEAIDQYYTQVVLVYRSARLASVRLNDEARAVFAKAAFRLVDEFEGRGKTRQALAILDLIVTSDTPAADEARLRVERLTQKGNVK